LFKRFHKAVEETGDLDLIPVMNLFMVLIPFLLMGAAFYHIGVIPSSLPTHTPDESDVPRTPTTVTVNLVITPDALTLTASSTSLSEEQLNALGATWPMQDGVPDTDRMQSQLQSIKERYPESNTVIVLPHPDLGYQNLVHVLDAAREYRSGHDANGDPTYTDLFPVVVFSRFIEASDSPEQPAEEIAE